MMPSSQPRTYRLSFRSILSLPFRICNPPPAVGKVRSCGVTPIYNVSLEDILERKHLPPLGLKDFEEWLLYVELSPENLYFILWLKEYTQKYRQWVSQSKYIQRHDSRADWKLHTSTHLAMFYSRAKQTFFTPNSNFELNLPSELLAPFHVGIGSPHPDPAVFDAVAVEVQYMLKESLRRFVTAQFNNVGNNRVLCGLIAGIFCCLLGAIVPILYNFTQGHSRWLRLSALPGLWLGLALILTSLNGVCLGVYVFGDLRQLRKFELSRPPISKPQFLQHNHQRPVISSPVSPLTNIQRPPPAYSPSRVRQSPRSSDSSSTLSVASRSCSDMSVSSSESMIHISPLYLDSDPIEGPAVSSTTPNLYAFPASEKPSSQFDDDDEDDQVFVPTAAFIHAYEYDDEVYDRGNKAKPDQRRPVSAFDFDALPRKPIVHPAPNRNAARSNPHFFIIEPEQASYKEDVEFTPRGFIRRMQSRCNVNKWLVFTSNGNGDSTDDKFTSHKSSSSRVPHEALIKRQFKMVKAVPAFGSPLTRVLNPVVIRGQWTIVVRSLIIACLITWVILGCLLAVPVP
ncbi:hypothetical protein C8J56DRAFT_457126 [Mycena floridula]|nr:hypothetical protein C8J56DRAFT_457126 [Mycena floridula]